MDSANRTIEDVELEGYYTAALAFIDPQLELASPLDAIESAAQQRQQHLLNLPPEAINGDLRDLEDALLFVRQKHERIAQLVPVATPVTVDEPLHDDPALAIDAEDPEVESFQLDAITPEHNGSASAYSNGNGSHDLAGSLVVALPKRRSPLSRLWEETEASAAQSVVLPEAQAWPLAKALLLLAGEAWLALFAGWTATRLIAWPSTGGIDDVTTLAAHGLVLLGLATAAVSGWLILRYRTGTRCIAALVHAGAVVVVLDLVAWKNAAQHALGFNPPAFGYWEALVVVWLVAAAYAHIADLRR